MKTVIELPHVGESVAEGVMGKWLKKVGERFSKYEPLVEVMTDKVTMEVPAPFDGVLSRILVNEGDTVPMGSPIAEVETEQFDEEPEQEKGKPVGVTLNEHADDPELSPEEITRRARIGTFTEGQWGGPTGGLPEEGDNATSLVSLEKTLRESSGVVARLAHEHNVDLNSIRGSGLGGRISKKDLLQYMAKHEKESDPSSSPKKIESAGVDEETVALTPLRRTIAATMVRSAQEIPHAWMAMEVDATPMVARRGEAKQEFQERAGVPLTFLPFVINVVTEALREHPDANARWGDDKIIHHNRIHVGIAVGTSDGLVVPVIHDADSLGIAELARVCHDLINRAQTGTLRLPDVRGGTFTVNNTGVLGSVYSGPLINYPQAAIVTTEAIVRRPVVGEGDTITIRHMMNICLSFDHRVLDGLGASSFLNGIKRRLEGIGPNTVID